MGRTATWLGRAESGSRPRVSARYRLPRRGRGRLAQFAGRLVLRSPREKMKPIDHWIGFWEDIGVC